MRRFLRVWGPNVVGLGAVCCGIEGIVWCALGSHWYVMVPSVLTTVVGFFATLGDLLFDGPPDRRTALGAEPCSGCVTAARRLACVTKDRDELREALAVLQIEATTSPQEKP